MLKKYSLALAAALVLPLAAFADEPAPEPAASTATAPQEQAAPAAAPQAEPPAAAQPDKQTAEAASPRCKSQTGSRIRKTCTDPQTVSRDDINRSGATNLGDRLQRANPGLGGK